jgi:hypothetical protein
MNSTRRFTALAASSVPGTLGRLSPKPREVSRSGAMPSATSVSRTVLARASLSAWLRAAVPVRSVCPSMLTLMPGLALRIEAAFSTTA